MPTRPTVLVTNDDGIESAFLEALVLALREFFEVKIAAPAAEQSWIGRAMSRRRQVAVRTVRVADQEGWAIDGTPTDCVNIALGHFLEEPPTLLVSGINIGYNTTLPLLLSSGTVAGAIEGAHWGLPAIATSMAVSKEHFAAVSQSKGRELPESVAHSLTWAARKTAQFAAKMKTTPNRHLQVENLNFPAHTTKSTELVRTVPARVDLGCLFQRVSPGSDVFEFRYHSGKLLDSEELSDRHALLQGLASHSTLAFADTSAPIDF